MISFKGEYEHSLDNKGRIALPAKMRKTLGDSAPQFTLLCGLDKCLYLFPQESWLEFEQQIRSVNRFNRNDLKAMRYFLRSAVDLELDKQYRLSLPSKHLQFAGIDDKATFVGMGDRIEIWSPQKLEESFGDWSDEEINENIERVFGGLNDI